MTDTLNQLNELREGRLAEIKANNSHIESLKDEIRRLEGEVRGLDMAIEICERELPTATSTTTTTTTTLPPQKYANSGLTEAVLDVVNSAGLSPGLAIADIVNNLTFHGYKSGSKDLYSTVYTIARRLVKQGKVRDSNVGNKRVFTKI